MHSTDEELRTRPRRVQIRARSVLAGRYFADFVCRDKRLIVEIDGAMHSTDEELRHDARRTDFLLERGYRVLRIANDDVYRNLEGALETILAKLNEKPDD